MRAAEIDRIEREVGLTICETFSNRGITVEGRISAKDFTWLIAQLRQDQQALKWIKAKTADKRNPAVAFVCDKILQGESFNPLRESEG